MRGAVERLVEELVDSRQANAAAALLGSPDRVLATATAGHVDLERTRRVDEETLFDLASLSKPVAATLALHLDSTGECRLEEEVVDLFAASGDVDPRIAERSLEDLQRHRAGFAPWAPLWRLGDEGSEIRRRLLSGELLEASEPTYSDLGYVLWSFAVEERLGRSVATLVDERLPGTLGTGSGREDRAAVCLLSNDRERELASARGIELETEAGPWRGVPQDGNARFLGGFPGHAGLFGSVRDLWRLGVEWLRPGELFGRASATEAREGDGEFALGWWSGRARRHTGPSLSEEAVGIVGFTGGSWFVDPGRELVLVLLAHRTGLDVEMAPHRRRFHTIGAELSGH